MSEDRGDRDRRRVKTPPAGVRAQTAPPTETWDDPDDGTPPLGTIATGNQLYKIGRSVRKTVQVASDRVDALRAEVRSDIVRVDGKVEALASHVADLRHLTGQIEGKLNGIGTAMEQDREERAQERAQHATMRVTAFAAEVEVDKTRQLSKIDVERSEAISQIELRRERSRLMREVALKIFAGISAIWAVISAYMLSRCGG